MGESKLPKELETSILRISMMTPQVGVGMNTNDYKSVNANYCDLYLLIIILYYFG